MSMHLDSPALTTIGKKKGKLKFKSSEAKKKFEQLDREWNALQKKWEPKKNMKKVFKEISVAPNMSTPRITNDKNIPSLVTPGGDCNLKESPNYTGTKMLGVSQMHKSNAVPVFSDEEVKDISKMRR